MRLLFELLCLLSTQFSLAQQFILALLLLQRYSLSSSNSLLDPSPLTDL